MRSINKESKLLQTHMAGFSLMVKSFKIFCLMGLIMRINEHLCFRNDVKAMEGR